jgi:hypothetical protein
MIYYNDKKQIIAWMNEGKTDNILRKEVLGSKHMLRSPKSWCVDKSVIDDAVQKEAIEIRVLDKESGLVYKVSMQKFLEKKMIVSRGFGTQYGLPLTYWETYNPNQATL